nr:uncharacterized protein LOC109164471 [Ipomoea trifida]
MIIKNYPLTIEGVQTCIKNNDLDETNVRDVAYASIVVNLAETNMIPRTSDVDYASTNAEPNANTMACEPSAPELVRRALRMIVGTDLIKMIDPRAILRVMCRVESVWPMQNRCRNRAKDGGTSTSRHLVKKQASVPNLPSPLNADGWCGDVAQFSTTVVDGDSGHM